MPEVLIDAIALADASAYRGIGTYVRQLLAGLAEGADMRVAALCRPGTALPAGVRPLPIRRLAPGRFRRAEHELLLPLDLLRRRAEVFHSPALDPPWCVRTPWVQTLHDVIPLVFDDPDLAADRRRWQRQASRYRRADAIVAVSRYTADVGMSVLGLDARRVEVIPHGVGSDFQPHPDESERRNLLMVGEYSRRKGFSEAFAVAAGLAELGYAQRLRVAGRIAPWVRPAVEGIRAASPAPDRIEFLGFVDDLVAEYQQAEVLIMSSRYEGFGLPVLEAMACGTPVVSFANSSLSEVVGDAGLLVADGDVTAMTRAVRSLLDDGQRWRELSARGLERVKQFSWERSVRAHAELLRHLAVGAS